jgi:hypothetical protein
VSLERRFRLAYFGLAMLFGAAIGALIVVVERPAPAPPAPWSAWQPTADGPGARQAQIAKHIERQYRLPSGKRLVNVLAGGPGPATDPIQLVAISRTLNPQHQSDVLTTFNTEKTAMFILCGDGPKCSIGEGTPSVARGKVLGREALELALYTFRYIDDADSVVAFFPPGKGQKPSHALLFTKEELSDQLHSPLRQTLPRAKPPLPGDLTAAERKVIDTLTGARVFKFRVEQGQSGARVLVLVPETA